MGEACIVTTAYAIPALRPGLLFRLASFGFVLGLFQPGRRPRAPGRSLFEKIIYGDFAGFKIGFVLHNKGPCGCPIFHNNETAEGAD